MQKLSMKFMNLITGNYLFYFLNISNCFELEVLKFDITLHTTHFTVFYFFIVHKTLVRCNFFKSLCYLLSIIFDYVCTSCNT